MSTKKRVLKSMGYPLAACAAFAVMNTAVFAETDENQPDMAENQASETTMTNDQQTSAEPSIEETEQQQQQDEIDQINKAIDQRQKLMQKNNANNLNAPNENNAETNGEDSKDTQLITDRPEQSEEVETTIGDVDQKNQGSFDNIENGFEIFVDKNGVYRVTFTIDENAEAEELTIELSKALDALQRYAAVTGSTTMQPGDTRAFEVWINSESGHTYRYKKGSFVLTTPEVFALSKEELDQLKDEGLIDEETYQEKLEELERIGEVIGFDGQQLDSGHLSSSRLDVHIYHPAFREPLIDNGVPESDIDSRHIWSGDITRTLNDIKNRYEKDSIKSAVEQLMCDYYSKEDNTKYENINDVLANSPNALADFLSYTFGYQVCEIDVERSVRYNAFYNNIIRYVYANDKNEIDDITGGEKGITETTKTIYSNVLDHDDGTIYDNCVSAIDAGFYNGKNGMLQGWKYSEIMSYLFGLPEDSLLAMDEDGNILLNPRGYPICGFGTGNEADPYYTASNYEKYGAKKRVINTTEATYNNVEWHKNKSEYARIATIAEYMKGTQGTKLSDIDKSVWEKADDFFDLLLKNGICKDPKEARQVSFMMAFNIDGLIAGNGYQDTVWGWHNTIKLERVDGELKLEKVDDKGNPLDATFQLWYYVDVNNDGQYTDGVDDKYFYTTIKDDSGKSIPGFVKYDPSNKTLEYTIDTTGGKLDINYKMLEGITYYLQEVLAPKGYSIDSTVYIICDEDSLEAAESMVKQDSSVSGRTYKHAGAIDSQTPLKIQIVNTKETTPPEPEEPKKPTPPEAPVTPTSEQPKIEVATGVFVDAQLWMSLMGASAVSLAGARRLKRRNRIK